MKTLQQLREESHAYSEWLRTRRPFGRFLFALFRTTGIALILSAFLFYGLMYWSVPILASVTWLIMMFSGAGLYVIGLLHQMRLARRFRKERSS